MSKLCELEPDRLRRAISSARAIREEARTSRSAESEESRTTRSAESEEKKNMCRICFENEPPFISPCGCKGTQAHVHPECLDAWRQRFPQFHRNFNICRECRQRFGILPPITVSIRERQPQQHINQRPSLISSLLDPVGILVLCFFYNSIGIILVSTDPDYSPKLKPTISMAFSTACIGSNSLVCILVSLFANQVNKFLLLMSLLNVLSLTLWWLIEIKIGIWVTFGLSVTETTILLFDAINLGTRCNRVIRIRRRVQVATA